MKRIIFAALLFTSSASAQNISADGCRVLGDSAEDAAKAISSTVAQAHSDAIVAVIPTLPPDAQRAADKMEKARQAALGPMDAYASAMAEFAKAMRNCAQ